MRNYSTDAEASPLAVPGNRSRTRVLLCVGLWNVLSWSRHPGGNLRAMAVNAKVWTTNISALVCDTITGEECSDSRRLLWALLGSYY